MPLTINKSADEKFGSAAAEALFDRSGLRDDTSFLSHEATDLYHLSLLQMAEKSLQLRGVPTVGMDRDELARHALQGGGEEIHIRAADGGARPGDFPNVLSALMGKMLEPAAEYAPATYRNWASRLASVADFKPKTLVATGEFGEFPLVPDGEDFEASTIGEEASLISTDRYGDEWILTPVMIANDDLDALREATVDKVVAHEMTLNRLCLNLLTGNVTLPDGHSLFSTEHGNDITSGAAPSTTELSSMRLKLRQQKGVSGERTLNLPLRSLLIPEDLETATQQLLANVQVVPTSANNADIFRGSVRWDVEPMLGEDSNVKYYGFADPRAARAIVYVHQRGFERLKVRNYFNDRNGCRHVQFEGRFGASVRNWRGVVRNAGA